MYKDKSIGVVVPAYNEEKLIGQVIEAVPDYVDYIIVVDDRSRDKTSEQVKQYQSRFNNRLILIQHESNQGVGGAIVTGYQQAVKENIDIVVIMAGDAQMNPDELPKILDPITENKADYVKGNRLFTGEAWKIIPKYRYIGNATLSLLTKIASGYWHIADSQAGFTAVSLEALKTMDLGNIYKRYGFPNDMLVHLNVYNLRVIDVPVTPIYNIGEKSGVKLWKVIPTLSFLLIRRFLWRLKEKYVIRDFHPLVFFYLMGFTLSIGGFLLGAYESYLKIFKGATIPMPTIVLVALLVITGLQSLFFAMWFDMEYNKELK